jgi:hypothetical protein
MHLSSSKYHAKLQRHDPGKLTVPGPDLNSMDKHRKIEISHKLFQNTETYKVVYRI